MSELVAQAVDRLRAAGVRLDSGLTNSEVSGLEKRLNFKFGPEHRQLLQTALPAGHRSWPDWRNGSPADLRQRLDWPTDGVLFDVHNNAFWPTSWGERSADRTERERVARTHLSRVPRLVPLHSHRYLTVDHAYEPSPVFSVYQSDVIYYGDNLLDYVAHEFHAPPLCPSPTRPVFRSGQTSLRTLTSETSRTPCRRDRTARGMVGLSD